MANGDKCPTCGYKLLKQVTGGVLLRSRCLILAPTGVSTHKCPKCNTVHQLNQDVMETLQKAIFLKKDKPQLQQR